MSYRILLMNQEGNAVLLDHRHAEFVARIRAEELADEYTQPVVLEDTEGASEIVMPRETTWTPKRN